MKLNLDPTYYFDTGIFRNERDNLFSSSWQLMGPVSQLSEPGRYISEDIAGMKVIIIRGQDG
jgi:choline monooxygenase